jgi:hypothetical protein
MSTTATPWATSDQDELDEGQEDEETTPLAEGAGKPAKDEADGKAQAHRSRRSTGDRRAVERALAVARLDRRQRELLARVLGDRGYDDSDDAIVRIVIGSLDPGSIAAGALSALLEISSADPLEAGVASMDLASERKLFSGAWAALVHLEAVKGPAPATTAKAGLAIAKAAQGLPKPALGDLGQVVSVLDN